MRFGINPMQFYARPDGTHDMSSGPGAAEVAALVGRYGFDAVQADLRQEPVVPLPRSAPGYLSAHLGEHAAFDATMAAYEVAARRSRALGLTDLVVACALTPAHRARAGQRAHEPVDRSTIAEVARQLDAVGAVTADYGVRACFHPHVGSPIETPDEVVAILDATDPSLVALCPDTGHLAWGGVHDVTGFLAQVSARIGMLHVKDVDEEVIDEGRSGGWDYGEFVRHHVWREPGTGDLAVATMLRPWLATDVWCVIEVDVAAAATAEESVAICGRFVDELR
jgi:inosose dehydratase